MYQLFIIIIVIYIMQKSSLFWHNIYIDDYGQDHENERLW